MLLPTSAFAGEAAHSGVGVWLPASKRGAGKEDCLKLVGAMWGLERLLLGFFLRRAGRTPPDTLGRLALDGSVPHLAAETAVMLALLLGACSHAVAQADDARRLFQEAWAAQQRGDAALAAREYRELLKLHPDMTAARAHLGGVLVSLGRFDEAIAQYRAALAQAPGNLDLRLDLARAYYKKGDAAKAARELKSLHDEAPADVKVATLLGDCDQRLGRDDEAIRLLLPLERAEPANLDVAWVLGSALVHAGRTREGLERIERVLEQRPSAEAYALAAHAYMKLADFGQARQKADLAMRLDPHYPGLLTLRGMILECSGDAEGAMRAYREALKANPNDFEAHLRLGTALYDQRQLDEARQHLQRAITLQPASRIARYELARVERAQGQLAAAVEALESVVHDDPGWIAPHVELAALYYRLHRAEDGAREKAIVDRLTAEQQRRDTKPHIMTPQVPLR
jgi:tetratricopeptide (TPR) repeat protein